MKEKKFNKKILFKLIPYVLVLAMAAVIVFMPNTSETKTEEVSEFSSVDRIAELATLKCYYHNVADFEKQPNGFFKYGLAKYGYKKLWMEYDGYITYGIDASKVEITGPDEDGVVEVYIPNPTIVGDPGADKSSIKMYTETGWYTEITTEDQAKALAEAQKTMEENAEKDENMKLKAKANAKEIFKDYVIKVGETLGKTYTVKFVDKK